LRFAGWIFALLLAAIAPEILPAQDYLNCGFVPGWQQAGANRSYTSDNLYEYKDGGAEGYLIFGFERMRGVDCQSGPTTLSIDVSSMADADSAYGLFAANRDPNQPIAKLGMGGQILPQSLIFAKGKYFIEMVETDGSTDKDQSAALLAFAAKMVQLLEGRGTPPEILEWFPAENLASVRLVPESVLGLRALKRGYVAKYKQGQAFIVPEDSPDAAAAVMKELRGRFAPVAPAQVADEAFQAKVQYLDGICIFRKGRYVAGIANMTDAQSAATEGANLAERIR
jgi:hypothetical protein